MSAKGKSASDVRKERQAKMKAKNKSKRKDPESEMTEEEKATKKAEERKQFILTFCTKLYFTFSNGDKTEKLFEGARCETYSDLQRLIAQITPRSLRIFLCSNMNGEILTAENFINTDSYRVREMSFKKLESTAKSKWRPKVDARWEFYDYHGGAPPGWVDKIEVEKQKREEAKKVEAQRKKMLEEAEAMLEKFDNGGEEAEEGESDGEDPFA
jgi:hypothetical protein